MVDTDLKNSIKYNINYIYGDARDTYYDYYENYNQIVNLTELDIIYLIF